MINFLSLVDWFILAPRDGSRSPEKPSPVSIRHLSSQKHCKLDVTQKVMFPTLGNGKFQWMECRGRGFYIQSEGNERLTSIGLADKYNNKAKREGKKKILRKITESYNLALSERVKDAAENMCFLIWGYQKWYEGCSSRTKGKLFSDRLPTWWVLH